jgi:WS/DGAT C-terminal domain
VLAAVAGGLRHWSERTGKPHDLRVQIPVSMHQRERHDEGNRDSFLNVDLPLSEADPVARLERIGAETRERKEHHDAAELYAFFHALSHVRPLFAAAERYASQPREFALSVSNVPGPREKRWFMGSRVEELYTIAEPADRHALRVSVVSSAGTMFFALCADPDAIEGLEEIALGIDRSVEELLVRTGA